MPSSNAGESKTALCLAVNLANQESSQCAGVPELPDGGGVGAGDGAVVWPAVAGAAHAVPAMTIADAAIWPRNSRRAVGRSWGEWSSCGVTGEWARGPVGKR